MNSKVQIYNTRKYRFEKFGQNRNFSGHLYNVYRTIKEIIDNYTLLNPWKVINRKKDEFCSNSYKFNHSLVVATYNFLSPHVHV